MVGHGRRVGGWRGRTCAAAAVVLRFAQEEVCRASAVCAPYVTVTTGSPGSGDCRAPITTADECRGAAGSLGLPLSAAAQDVTDRPSGCWAQVSGGSAVYFNLASTGVSAACSAERPCMCCTEVARTCAPRPVVSGLAGQGDCAVPLATKEDCEQVAWLQPDLAQARPAVVEQTEADRPAGCWQQQVATGVALYFNRPPLGSSGAECADAYKCICCGSTTTTTTFTGICQPDLVTYGTPFGPTCPMPVTSIEACRELAGRHPTLASWAGGVQDHVAADRPSACWYQTRIPQSVVPEGLWFNTHPDGRDVQCSGIRPCVCCRDPAAPTPPPWVCHNVAFVWGVTIAECESFPQTREECSAAAMLLPETANQQAMAQAENERPEGCWWQVDPIRGGGTLYFNAPAGGTSSAGCSSARPCLCCMGSTTSSTTTSSTSMSSTTTTSLTLTSTSTSATRTSTTTTASTSSSTTTSTWSSTTTTSSLTSSSSTSSTTTRTSTSSQSSTSVTTTVSSITSTSISTTTSRTSTRTTTTNTVTQMVGALPFEDTAQAAGGLWAAVLVFGLAAAIAVAALVHRFRRSKPPVITAENVDERQADFAVVMPVEDRAASPRRETPKSSPRSNPRSDAEAFRDGVVQSVFDKFDMDGDGYLTCSELRSFAELVGFAGDNAKWRAEWLATCSYLHCDPVLGIDLQSFQSLVSDDSAQGCWCSSDDLALILSLGPAAPDPGAEAWAAGAAGAAAGRAGWCAESEASAPDPLCGMGRAPRSPSASAGPRLSSRGRELGEISLHVPEGGRGVGIDAGTDLREPDDYFWASPSQARARWLASHLPEDLVRDRKSVV